MKKENIQNEFVVRCGKTTDSMEILEKTCKEEAEKLVKTLNLAEEIGRASCRERV